MFYIKDFLSNPGGKGNTSLNISAVKEKFTERYEKMVKDIKYRIFIVKKDVYFLINIPSSVQGIYYDILVKFNGTNKSTGKSIVDMNMQIFSNSPSFLYTYAHAYDKQGLFLKDCKRKLSPKMLDDIAKSKNPQGMLSYDFSVFAALHFIVSNDYMSMETIESYGVKTTKTEVLKHVKNADALQKDRKYQKDNLKNLVKEEKLKYKRSAKLQEMQDNPNIKAVRVVGSTKQTKTVKSVKKVKKKG